MEDARKTILYVTPDSILDAAEDVLKENPELLDEFLGRVCEAQWDWNKSLIPDFVKQKADVIKAALKRREDLNIGYGGNVSYRYKKAREALRAEKREKKK